MENGDPKETLTIVGFALVIIYILIKDVIKPLLDKHDSESNGNGRNAAGMLKDLWFWHAPDHSGEQGWKGKQVERLVGQMNSLIREQIAESKRSNKIIEDCMTRRNAILAARKERQLSKKELEDDV